ncbi:MAG: hypothetical protein ACKO37_05015 [Vampirovibrionales bacterium]
MMQHAKHTFFAFVALLALLVPQMAQACVPSSYSSYCAPQYVPAPLPQARVNYYTTVTPTYTPVVSHPCYQQCYSTPVVTPVYRPTYAMPAPSYVAPRYVVPTYSVPTYRVPTNRYSTNIKYKQQLNVKVKGNGYAPAPNVIVVPSAPKVYVVPQGSSMPVFEGSQAGGSDSLGKFSASTGSSTAAYTGLNGFPVATGASFGSISGAAGIAGDPDMGLYTPAHLLGVSAIPAHLRTINITHASRGYLDTQPLLVDPDGLTLSTKSTHVSPGRWGLGSVTLDISGVGAVTFVNTGVVCLNGQPIGSLGQGLSASLPGVQVGPHGFYAETAGYMVTGSLRHPAGAGAYYDLKVAELPNHPYAAMNAYSPFKVENAMKELVGLADLLKLEPGSLH